MLIQGNTYRLRRGQDKGRLVLLENDYGDSSICWVRLAELTEKEKTHYRREAFATGKSDLEEADMRTKAATMFKRLMKTGNKEAAKKLWKKYESGRF